MDLSFLRRPWKPSAENRFRAWNEGVFQFSSFFFLRSGRVGSFSSPPFFLGPLFMPRTCQIMTRRTFSHPPPSLLLAANQRRSPSWSPDLRYAFWPGPAPSVEDVGPSSPSPFFFFRKQGQPLLSVEPLISHRSFRSPPPTSFLTITNRTAPLSLLLALESLELVPPS